MHVTVQVMARRVRQLAFDLREGTRWGGKRAHRARAPLARCHACHITLKVRRGIPSLRTVKLVRALERSFAATCDRGRFRLVQYSIQHDHVHLIAEAASQHDLACGMKSIAARIARGVNRVFRLSGRVLADRYHLHVLRTPREVRHALAYVLLNARRHVAKMGRRLSAASIDPASSGRFFSGWNRRFHPASSLDPPPVAPPRTWLLAIGWRRHGLLDPAEVPDGAASLGRARNGAGPEKTKHALTRQRRVCHSISFASDPVAATNAVRAAPDDPAVVQHISHELDGRSDALFDRVDSVGIADGSRSEVEVR